MEHGHFMVKKPIELKFKIKNAIPDPYLGALGHVVIIDEQAEKFIHVHPISNNETIFETQFEKAGIYKLWAEFKFGRSEEHTSELQSRGHLVCRLLLEKKNKQI